MVRSQKIVGAMAIALFLSTAVLARAQQLPWYATKQIDAGAREINLARGGQELPKLQVDKALTAAAQDLADVLVEIEAFDECGKTGDITGETPGARAQRHGYPRNVGASIAQADPDVEQSWENAVDCWKKWPNFQNLYVEPYVAVGTGSATRPDGSKVYVVFYGR